MLVELLALFGVSMAAVIVALVMIFKRLMSKLRSIEQIVTRLPDRTWHDLALRDTIRTESPLPQPGGWAASSDFLLHLIDILKIQRPLNVVELGSGLSTIVVGHTLRNLGNGRLVSIDHDESYASETRMRITDQGLDEFVSVRTAELRVSDALKHGTPWYHLSQLDDLGEVDLLIVDGPPKSVDVMVRLPALEVFRPRLSREAVIVLDDADRPGETEILKRWHKDLKDWTRISLSAEKGMALLTNNQSIISKYKHTHRVSLV